MKFSESIAFNATFLLTISIWFGFSRKTMPDVFSMSLMLMALYQVFTFLGTKNWWHLFYFIVLGALAVLAKLPAIYCLCILALPFLSKNTNYTHKLALIISSLLIIATAYWWYFIWGEYLFRTYEYQLFFPRTLKEGIHEMAPYWKLALEQFYFSAFNSYLAFGLFIFGLVICLKQKLKLLIYLFSITLIVFIAFALKTGSVFALHSYYIIPFVPMMAIIAAIGLSKVSVKIYSWVFLLISIESIANQHNDFIIKDSEKFKLSIENEINQVVPKNEKIALGGDVGPQYIYFAHRKGWGLSVEQTLDTSYMNYLINHDYKYLVLVKREFTTLPNFNKINESDNLIFYRLDK